MLNFNLPFRDVFTKFSLVESSFKTCLSNEEWDVAQAITTFLKAFVKITNLFSGSSYPTADKYFLHVLRIQELLMKNKFSEIEVIRNMSLVMIPKLEKYWDEYSEVLSMAIILDPRYKVQFVEYRLKSVENDESVVKRKVEKIVDAIKLLFSEYVGEFSKDGSQSQVEQSTFTTTSIDQHSDDEFDDFEKVVPCSNSTRSELGQYLEEKLLGKKPSFDILKEWKNSLAERYPIPSKMALDILSIPITTVASESTFSIGAKILIKYRSSLLLDNAEALMCCCNWICGFQIQDKGGRSDEELVMHLLKNQGSKGSTVAGTPSP